MNLIELFLLGPFKMLILSLVILEAGDLWVVLGFFFNFSFRALKSAYPSAELL